MKKTFSFGKFAVYGKTRVNEIAVEVSYETASNGNNAMRFSVCAEVWNARHTDIVMGGQCLDSLLEYLGDNEKFKTIYGLWERNHLNDMDASANDAQREAVKEYEKTNAYDYDKVCEYLKERNLFEVEVNGKKCKYGYEWYYREISEEDKKTIERLLTED